MSIIIIIMDIYHQLALLFQESFIGVIGKVGSGKSSLLAAITAELHRDNGDVFLEDIAVGFGFAAQEPWIQHGTVKENILFGKAYRRERYNSVVEACALLPDIQVRG